MEELTIDGNDIKMNLRYITWEGMDIIYLGQDRKIWYTFANTLMKFSGYTKCGKFVEK